MSPFYTLPVPVQSPNGNLKLCCVVLCNFYFDVHIGEGFKYNKKLSLLEKLDAVSVGVTVA